MTIEGEEQGAGGAAVKAVGRPDPLSDLVAQDLDREARFVAVDFRTMNEQVRWLVDDDDVFVAIKQLKWWFSDHWQAAAVNPEIRQKSGPLPAREWTCR